jgi:phosphohistidine phosphatase SixA
MRDRLSNVPLLLLSALCLFSAVARSADFGQSLPREALAKALHEGGFVVLMRHANSPHQAPAEAEANSDNPKHERQLDEAGRRSAVAMGDAIRLIRIPIGQLWSSPTYRALETIKLAKLGTPEIHEELGDSGQSMQTDASGGRGAWLRSQTAKVPAQGTNTLIVTHYPNIMEAFKAEAAGLEEGEALIFRPDGRGSATVVARVKIDQWPLFAAR